MKRFFLSVFAALLMLGHFSTSFSMDGISFLSEHPFQIPYALLGATPSHSLNASAADDSFDFVAVWKKNTRKNLISITITGSSQMVNCYIYDSSPFEGGRLIKQIDNISERSFEIEMEEKSDVYLWIFADEFTMAAKWLKYSK